MTPDEPLTTGDDPPPQPPREPDPGECCGSGCNPCIYDHYWEAVDRYEKALAAWRVRHDKRQP